MLSMLACNEAVANIHIKVVIWMVQGEVKLLQALLPKYLEHVQKYPHTLLIKFFGLYRVTPNQGAKVQTRSPCLPKNCNRDL